MTKERVAISCEENSGGLATASRWEMCRQGLQGCQQLYMPLHGPAVPGGLAWVWEEAGVGFLDRPDLVKHQWSDRA